VAKKRKPEKMSLERFGSAIEAPVVVISTMLEAYDLRVRGGILTLLIILWLKDLHPSDRKKIIGGLHETIDSEFEEKKND
jgi:hypothetical protein